MTATAAKMQAMLAPAGRSRRLRLLSLLMVVAALGLLAALSVQFVVDGIKSAFAF